MTLKEKLIITREAKWFSNLTTAIIIFYASMLGFKTLGDIEGNFSTFIYWLDNFITIYFLIEIIIKMSAEKNFMNFFKSGWNIFDFIIVAITLIPLDNSSVAAIARLLRIFRVLRLITSRPELKKNHRYVIRCYPIYY
jgi:voltage-gated sodium channel